PVRSRPCPPASICEPRPSAPGRRKTCRTPGEFPISRQQRPPIDCSRPSLPIDVRRPVHPAAPSLVRSIPSLVRSIPSVVWFESAGTFSYARVRIVSHPLFLSYATQGGAGFRHRRKPPQPSMHPIDLSAVRPGVSPHKNSWAVPNALLGQPSSVRDPFLGRAPLSSSGQVGWKLLPAPNAGRRRQAATARRPVRAV